MAHHPGWLAAQLVTTAIGAAFLPLTTTVANAALFFVAFYDDDCSARESYVCFYHGLYTSGYQSYLMSFLSRYVVYDVFMLLCFPQDRLRFWLTWIIFVGALLELPVTPVLLALFLINVSVQKVDRDVQLSALKSCSQKQKQNQDHCSQNTTTTTQFQVSTVFALTTAVLFVVTRAFTTVWLTATVATALYIVRSVTLSTMHKRIITKTKKGARQVYNNENDESKIS